MAIGAAQPRLPQATTVALISLMVGSTVVSMTWRGLDVPGNPDARGVSLQQREALIGELRERRVGTAVASYWNSHVISVLSGGQLMVYPIAYGDRLSAFPHHVPHAPHDGSGGAREAVILTKNEFAIDGGAAVLRQLGDADETIEVGPFQVWIYEHDIVDPIYGEGHRFDVPVDSAAVAVDTGTARYGACGPGRSCTVHLRLHNIGRETLASAGRYPIRIGLRGEDAEGNLIAPDIGRIEFPLPLSPGAEVEAQTTLATLPAGVVAIRPCLLQENVSWLCDRTTPGDPAVLGAPIPGDQLGVRLSDSELDACPSTAKECSTRLTVTNTGRQLLSSQGSLPLRLGVQALDDNGRVINHDAGRADFPHPVPPGQSVQIDVQLHAEAGAKAFRLCLLQELVAWHCERTEQAAAASMP